MLIGGGLNLEVDWDGKQLTGAALRSGRPLHASRVLEGGPAQRAIGLVPRLFALCGRSQTVAAAAALEAAAGERAGEGIVRAREAMLSAECAHEHLWRLLLDLPLLLGWPARPEGFAGMRQRIESAQRSAGSEAAWWKAAGSFPEPQAWRRLAGELADFLGSEVLGVDAERFLRFSADGELGRWREAGNGVAAGLLRALWDLPAGACEVALLRLPDEEALAGEFASAIAASEGFAAAPVREGAPAQTGALAREASRPLVADALGARGSTVAVRVLARLAELAGLPARMRALCAGEPVPPWMRCVAPHEGCGMAAVETARGVLMHRVDLEDGRVSRYRIVAPTEWNFHPQGAFVRGLAGTPASDTGEAHRAAALLAHALDPCVACEIRVRHA
ncbi:MAG: hypothetical protein CO164_07270 [Rhodocyclales bacterium CG_4_9_14_3_um_filter_68_10]|nr:MAG: hypothetical protein CO164_07270 [Rhodocyclales bacterium CG_4_9_14_3_um_filter_68_10]